jgi:ATP-dependent DNA helicase RecQ
MSIHEILKTYWGYDQFRPMQEDIIRSVISGDDTLALLPTGGGKSLCFQVPGLFMSGTTLVISPLIALMKDQVKNLKQKGIKAEAIYSGMNYFEVTEIINSAIHGDTKFLYISPERLVNEEFRERIKQIRLNILAIDEAHCISQWGYDFRPPYLKIAEIRAEFPHIPVIALTATATARVIDDIQDKLLFKRKNAYRKSFRRENLIYAVLQDETKNEKLLQFLKSVPGSAVVYVRNRAKTQNIAEYLNANGITAHFYHAGLQNKIRDERQEEWIKDKVRVIVATNAFGMGIDKPDVRLVVHMDLPDSLEAYFQEAGRGGRDEKTAYAIALWNNSDIIDLEKYFQDAFPPPELIQKLYESVCNHLQIAEFSGADSKHTIYPEKFLEDFKISSSLFFNGIKFLERQGLLAFADVEQSFSKVHFHRDNLVYDDYTNEQADILKSLLRNYEGLFDHFVRISEKLISNKTSIPYNTVLKELHQLNKLEAIRYSSPKRGFTITFMQDRVPEQFFNLARETYTDRKTVAREKLDSVIQYVTRIDKCRSRILLEYFGETKSVNCGKCDICRETIHNKEADDDYAELLAFLAKFPATEIDIIELYKLQPAVKKHSGTLFKWCIDKGYLTLLPGNKLSIHKEEIVKVL